jgi:Dolichyl-phosphate-mannose-protein mannosyltransferase
MGPHASANRVSLVQQTTWALLILSSLALLGSSVYRATLAFGIDESESFAIFTGEPYWAHTAGHHPLNTTLMYLCSRLFGNSELSLRLPNLLAHVLYLLCVLALLKRVRDPVLQVLGFVLFNLNLLAIEYFAAARGYGLALAFEIASLYLFVRAYEQTGHPHLARDVSVIVAVGSLAVLSNYAWLNYYLPLLLVCGWLLLTDGSLRRLSRRYIGAALALIAGSGLFLSYILAKLFKLQRDGALYWGGHDSFVSDTVYGLVRCSLYSALSSPAAVRVISVILIGVFAMLLPLAIRQLWFGERGATFGMLVLLLAGAMALPILEHRFFGTLFPMERAALYYLPLCGTVLVYAFRVLRDAPSESWRSTLAPILAIATAVAVGWTFCRGFAERPCAWLADRHNREVLELIERDRAERSPTRKVKLRAPLILEPSLNFYRKTRGYTWLAPIRRGPIPDPDYIYTFETKLRAPDRGVRLASYSDVHTVLVRVIPGGGR